MDQFLDYWLSVLSTARPLPQSLILFFYGILFQLKIPVKILTYRFMWQIKPSSYYKWDYIQSCVCVCVCVCRCPYVLHLHYIILHFLYISIIKQQQGLYTWTILIFLIKKNERVGISYGFAIGSHAMRKAEWKPLFLLRVLVCVCDWHTDGAFFNNG